MGLSYHYEFTAPGGVPAEELEQFLQQVEKLAQSLGFAPTTVLNVSFDTTETRAFSRRLGGSFIVSDERLKGAAIPTAEQLRDHDPLAGEGRLVPERGVVLVVTDEHLCETCFGFLKYPEHVLDIHGRTVAEAGLNGRWYFRDFVDSPDRRYRTVVGCFQAAGYVSSVTDEFQP